MVLGDLRQDLLDEAKADLVQKGFLSEKISTTQMNLTDLATVKTTFDDAEKAFGKVDILVNIAGVIIGYYKLDDMREEDWDLTFNVNVKGLMEMSREFVKRLKARNAGGSIVNVASNAAKVCFADMADYNASKAAVMNLTQSMALEWAPYGTMSTQFVRVLSTQPCSASAWRSPSGSTEAIWRKCARPGDRLSWAV